MIFNEYIDGVTKELADLLSGHPAITVHEVPKNNGVKKVGITILYPGEVISPNIYIDEYFHEDMSEKDIKKIAKGVKSLYLKCRPDQNINVSFYMDYNAVKDKLFLKVINGELNREILKVVPHYTFLDMKVVVYCKMSEKTFGDGAILVYNSHLDNWGIDEETLFKDAYLNFLKYEEPELTNITEIMEHMMDDMTLSTEEKESIREDIDRMKEMYDTLPMHVLSNKNRYFGASIILNEDYLYNLCKSINSDFYILPSSIHELILIPQKCASSVWELKDMVRTVNETAVAREELLSYSVYLFSARERKVMIAM